MDDDPRLQGSPSWRQFTDQPLAQIDLKGPLSSNQGLHSLKAPSDQLRGVPAPVSIKASALNVP
jgi:hypothetical protein